MSAVLTVAVREIRSQRLMLMSALAVGALLSLTFAAMVRRGSTVPDQALVAILFCTTVPAAIALGAGASMLGRDLAERRLGFYFSRPIPVLHLWAGKVAGAAAVVILSFACIQASVFFSTMKVDGYLRVVALGTPMLLLVMAVGHVGTSMFRARSPWFFVDVVLAGASVYAIGRTMRAIVDAGAFLAAVRYGPALPLLLAGCMAALLAGALAQLAYGRTDVRRGHLALSVAVWASLFLVIGTFAAWQRWLLAGTPAQAGGAGYPLVVAPGGDAIFFRGLTARAGFLPFFFMDARRGAFVRLASEAVPAPTFSVDGRTAAWITGAEPFEPAVDFRPRLVVVRFGEDALALTRTPMPESARWHTVLALHPGGREAVLVGDDAAGIVDLAAARVAGQVSLRRVFAADVLPDGRIRLFRTTTDRDAALAVSVWTPGGQSLHETVRVPRAALLARRGDLAVAAVGPGELILIDLDRGAIHPVSGAAPGTLPRALVLGDGRVAVSSGDEVRIADATGATVARVALPPGSKASALREPQPGRLAVGVWSPVLSERRTLFVDTRTGAIVGEEAGLLPAGAPSAAAPQPSPGSLAARLFTDEEGTLLALERDGRRRVVLAAAGTGE